MGGFFWPANREARFLRRETHGARIRIKALRVELSFPRNSRRAFERAFGPDALPRGPHPFGGGWGGQVRSMCGDLCS